MPFFPRCEMPQPLDQQELLLAGLTEARQVLDALGAECAGIEARLTELQGRLAQGCFRLAVLGQFKRGKSSLLNALLGEPILPVGVLPLTAIPTVLRHGPERRVRVTRFDGWSEDHAGDAEVLGKVLARYVTERENPGNRLGITQVEVEHPSALLAKGVEIIDTPGIGSTFLHNTRTARAVLPVCDGALFVLSPDPPITEVELQFLRAVKDAAARVIVVLTKADRLSPSERHDVLAFLREVLRKDAGLPDPDRIFPVSAHQGLTARTAGESALWSESGMDELERYLHDFLISEKRTALIEAVRDKAARLLREALFTIDLQRKAIDLPRHELEQRSRRLDAHLAAIESEHTYFRDRLGGDRHRVLDEIDRRTDAMAAQARDTLTPFVRKAREAVGRGAGTGQAERHVRTAIAEAAESFFGRAAEDLQEAAATRFTFIQDSHCREVERLIERVRRTAADLFEVPCLDGVVLDRLDAVREPRLIQHRWITSFTEEAVSWLARLLPRTARLKQLERRWQADIEYLVARNVEELRWATRQNLEEALRAFQARMEEQRDAAIGQIRAAVQTALDRQTQREARAAPDLHRMKESRGRLEELLASMAPPERGNPGGAPV